MLRLPWAGRETPPLCDAGAGHETNVADAPDLLSAGVFIRSLDADM
jgi:hypothetical protein